MSRLDRWLSSRSRSVRWVIVLATWFAAGATDILSGCEFTLALLYLFPITLATWYIGKLSGGMIAVLSSLAVVIPDIVESGLLIEHPCYLPWKWFASSAGFLLVMVVMHALRKRLEIEGRLARRDSLTGLLNRRAFSEQLAELLKRVEGSGRPLSLAYLDVDDFKSINDDLGHHVGDRVLEVAGEVLAGSCRSGDIVARIGGDEFALLLPESERLDAEGLIARLQESLTRAFEAERLTATFSIGVVTFLTPPHTSDAAMMMADKVMYRVKGRGKNAVDFQVADV